MSSTAKVLWERRLEISTECFSVWVQATIQQLRERLEFAKESQAEDRARAEHAEAQQSKLSAQVGSHSFACCLVQILLPKSD